MVVAEDVDVAAGITIVVLVMEDADAAESVTGELTEVGLTP